MISRRAFLARATQLAVGAGAASTLGWLPGCGSDDSGATAMWAELQRRLRGPLLRPGDRGYRAAALPNNRRYADVRPAGIAQCLGADDVQTCVRWARENGIDLVPRGGGHSYSGYSTTTGLLVDLGRMRQIAVDGAGDAVTIAGGGRNADFIATLPAHARAVPIGTCPSVGVAGLILGGGVGFNSRRLGTSSDALLATEVVTADGELRRCDAGQHADLYWACRGGGGGNFGINTSFTLRTFATPDVTVFAFEWRGAEQAAALTAAMQPLLMDAPDTFSGFLSLYALGPATDRAADLFTYVTGQYIGSQAELLELLEPLLAVATPHYAEVRPVPYWEGQAFLAESGGTPDATDDRSNFADEPLPDEAIDAIIAQFLRFPRTPPGTYAVINLFAWVGGVINQVAPAATAYVHRTARYLIDLGAGWPVDAPEVESEAVAWVDELWRGLQPFVLPTAYQNFIDGALNDWQRAYYGRNFDALVQVKAAYDPDDLFHFPQSIPTHT